MFDTGEHADVGEITRTVAHEGRWQGELTQRALDGRDLLVEASVSILADDDGSVLGSVSIVREISGRKAAERQIAFQATHDGLTGLLNRTAFLEPADAYLERIMGLFTEPVRCRVGASHTVGVSVGVAHSKLDDTADGLFRRADDAMYKAKRSTEVASAYRTA